MYFLFNRTTLQGFFTYLNLLYMCTLCDYTGLFEMIVGVLTTCHTQHTRDSSICIFYLIEQHFKFLLHTLQVLYMRTLCDYTGLFKMIVGVLKLFIHNTVEAAVYVFFYLTEQHSKFCYIPYRCSICAPFVILQGFSK